MKPRIGWQGLKVDSGHKLPWPTTGRRPWREAARRKRPRVRLPPRGSLSWRKVPSSSCRRLEPGTPIPDWKAASGLGIGPGKVRGRWASISDWDWGQKSGTVTLETRNEKMFSHFGDLLDVRVFNVKWVSHLTYLRILLKKILLRDRDWDYDREDESPHAPVKF